MHTPFQILRTKQKTRRQRIELSLSPTKHSFSLQNSRPLTHKCQQSQTNLSVGRRKTVFSQSHDVWRKDKHANSVEKHQIKVQNTLKRMANYREAIGKNGMRLNQVTGINWASNKDKNLMVEGENCGGEDLIRQNRRKLEKMVANFNPETVQPSQNYPPDIVMGKCRHNKFKRLFAERQNTTQKTHAPSRKNNHKKSLNTNQFLICNNLQKGINEQEKSSCVLVLNKNQISNYIKDMKKRKYIPSKIQSESSEKCHFDVISKKASITYNFFINTKDTNSNFHKKQKDSQYYLSKKGFFENSLKSQRKKGIIVNGFDTAHLEGWQQQQGDQCQLLQMTSPADNFSY